MKASVLITSRAVRRLQQKTGKTDADISQEIGVTERSVRNWRRGLSVPTMSRAEQIAEAFGVSLWDFYKEGTDERDF